MRYSRRQTTVPSSTAAPRMVLAAILLLANAAAVVVLTKLLHANAALLFGLLRIVAVGAVVHIQSGRVSTGDKLVWTMLMAAVPVVGMLLYLMWGGERPGRHLSLLPVEPPTDREVERRQTESSHRRLAEALPAWQRTARMLQKRGFPLYRGTSAAYYSSGEAFFADVLNRLEGAERFIFLEFSALAEGKLWDRMRGVLLERAHSGVEICIILDELGSRTRIRREAVEAMRSAGIEVMLFGPDRRRLGLRLFPCRDHREIVCIDGQYACTGSAYAADECIGLARGRGEWRDSGVLLDGAGAWGLTRQWIHMWERLGGRLHNEHDYYRPAEERPGDGWCQPFAVGPGDVPGDTVGDLWLQCITNAHSYIWITADSFAVDDDVLRALCAAADSGVDVRICLPGVWRSTHEKLAAEACFDQLLEHGAALYLFEPGFLHAGSFVCDGQVAMVGKVGMDRRGFRLRGECGVVLYDMSAIGGLLEDMEAIQQRSERLERSQWSGRSQLQKELEKLMRAFPAWM